jgi:hypothetical protein
VQRTLPAGTIQSVSRGGGVAMTTKGGLSAMDAEEGDPVIALVSQDPMHSGDELVEFTVPIHRSRTRSLAAIRAIDSL